jgi:predicted DNA binding protein
MATIIEGEIPAAELALDHLLSTLSGVEVECERVVRSGDDAVMPLLRIRYADRDEVERVLDDDPSVRTATAVSEAGTDMLYRIDWVERVELLLGMLTSAEASILDAYGRNGRWEFRLLYPEREAFSETHRFCEEHGLSFDLMSIRELDGRPEGRSGLTEGQHRALALAMRRGYYEVPRKTSLKELASELDVSHQALSERLRRATESLVSERVMDGELPEEAEVDNRVASRG